MKLVAGPQESLTAPKGLLVDLEPQGKWDVWPLAKMVVWPPGPKSPSAHRRHCFATNCDPLVVLSLDVMCIQVATCESLHWKWLEKAQYTHYIYIIYMLYIYIYIHTTYIYTIRYILLDIYYVHMQYYKLTFQVNPSFESNVVLSLFQTTFFFTKLGVWTRSGFHVVL